MEPSPPSFSTPTVMLMLARFAPITMERLVEALHQRVPQAEGSAVLSSPGDGPSSIISVAGQLVALLAVDAPLPDGWLQVVQRSMHWPGAAEACTRHRAHIIVSLMAPTPDPLAGARAITAAAGALAHILRGIVLAGLWSATVLNSAEVWARSSVAAFAPYPDFPASLWVSQHPYNDERSGGVGVVTQGLAIFVGRELELTAPASRLRALLERAIGLTAYLIQNGPVMKDGSSFGVSTTERISVRLRASITFPGLEVIAGSLETIK